MHGIFRDGEERWLASWAWHCMKAVNLITVIALVGIVVEAALNIQFHHDIRVSPDNPPLFSRPDENGLTISTVSAVRFGEETVVRWETQDKDGRESQVIMRRCPSWIYPSPERASRHEPEGNSPQSTNRTCNQPRHYLLPLPGTPQTINPNLKRCQPA